MAHQQRRKNALPNQCLYFNQEKRRKVRNMTIKPLAYINVEERKLEWAEPITWHTPTVAKMDKIPLYLVKEQNIDYKKEWLKAKKQSDIYERWWIQYRDMAVKLDKELKELKEKT
jgi:hypothetical protein